MTEAHGTIAKTRSEGVQENTEFYYRSSKNLSINCASNRSSKIQHLNETVFQPGELLHRQDKCTCIE